MENLDTPNLAKINFLYLELLGGVPVKKKNTLYNNATIRKHKDKTTQILLVW